MKALWIDIIHLIEYVYVKKAWFVIIKYQICYIYHNLIRQSPFYRHMLYIPKAYPKKNIIFMFPIFFISFFLSREWTTSELLWYDYYLYVILYMKTTTGNNKLLLLIRKERVFFLSHLLLNYFIILMHFVTSLIILVIKNWTWFSTLWLI